MHPQSLSAGVSFMIGAALIALRAAEDPPAPRMMEGRSTQGSVRISPNHGVAGAFGTWVVTYTAGSVGIATGGGIRVQLPDSWHAGPRNSANRLQATDPQDEHYISAHSSREEVKLRAIVESERPEKLIKHAKDSLDGRSERYVFVVRVRVEQGRLAAGDSISVVYGDRAFGSLGMRAGAIATPPEPVLTAVDVTGTSRFQMLEKLPSVHLRPGDPVELRFHAPSTAVVGWPMRLLVSLVDQENNPADETAAIRITAKTGQAEYPAEIQIPPGRGYAEFEATPALPGIIRLHAEAPGLNLSALSNPAEAAARLPERQLYWGDLHSHGRLSWDGVGDRPFEYARFISGLDFYALTDHAMAPEAGRTRGLSDQQWAEHNARTDAHNDPLRFVTLHAYECSFGRPFGHHNVYFRGSPGPLVYPTTTTLEELWKLLRAGDALTIPHHTGKFPGGIDFGHHNPIFRRNFEIYSGHGLSEAYNPAHPLSFEHSKFTSDARSLPAPTFAQDAWKRSLVLSTIAASDDHRGQPGQPHYGLAAARAHALNRDQVFQALHDRHTYGTTGSKIILHFVINGTPMGQTATVGKLPAVSIRAHGTDRIAWVELLRSLATEETFKVIRRWESDEFDFETEYRDESFQAGAIYYVRLQQKNPVRGLPAMAWSSPIWTDGN